MESSTDLCFEALTGTATAQRRHAAAAPSIGVSWFCGGTTASDLQGTSWITAHGLKPLADQPPLIKQLWLLLPQGAVNTKAARQCLRLLRAQTNKAQMMQDLHEN